MQAATPDAGNVDYTASPYARLYCTTGLINCKEVNSGRYLFIICTKYVGSLRLNSLAVLVHSRLVVVRSTQPQETPSACVVAYNTDFAKSIPRPFPSKRGIDNELYFNSQYLVRGIFEHR